MSILRNLFERRALSAANFGFAIDDMGNASGKVVNQDSAMRMAAVWAALRLLSGDISSLPVDAYRTRNGIRALIDPQPAWIEQPDPTDPSVTGVEHFSQVVLSLLGDGNSFTLMAPDISDIAELRVLDPLKVEVGKDGRGRPSYIVRGASGQVLERFDWFNVLHIPYLRKPGAARGMSPVEAMAESIGSGLAAEEFQARFFSNGANLKGIIEVPREAGELSRSQIDEMVRQFRIRNGGLRNSHAVGALQGGASFKELTVKPVDALLIEAQKWSVEQIARAYGIPPHLLGSQEPGAQAYASVEQKSQDYVTHAVLPLTRKIEKAYSRLLPRGSEIKFNLRGLLRADAEKRAVYYQALLGTGAITPNRIAQLEEEETFEGGDVHLIAANNLQPLGQIGMTPAPQPDPSTQPMMTGVTNA